MLTAPAPLVVTLALDGDSQRRLEALRRRHFPPERNVVPAHVSLFHALPGEHRDRVLDDVGAAARRAAFPVRVGGVLRLGRGAALRVEAAELAPLHARLRAAWQPWLTPQDRAPLRAHVTVQNKVTPERARATVAQLEATVVPWVALAVGVDVWEYAGGPWEPVRRVAFQPHGDDRTPDA